MKTKKLVAVALISSLLALNITPALAINETTSTKKIKIDKVHQHKVKTKKNFDESYRYDYVNIDWWKNFGDDNLNNYINKAVQHNHNLKVASLTVDEYYQYVKLQFGKELPSVTIGASPAISKIGDASSQFGFLAPAIINYEADIFLKNRDKTKSQKKVYEMSKFDERSAYISIASAVGTTYFNIVRINEIIKIQEKIVNSRYDIYQMMLARNNAGLTSTADTVKANKTYINGKSELIELKKNRIKMLHQLAVLTGENPDNIDSLKISSYESIKFKGQITNSVQTEIITNRPDYLKAEKTLEKLGIDVRVAKKEFLPSITLSGLGVFNSGEAFKAITNGNPIWALAGQAMLPLFTGGQKIANLKVKKIQYDKALENYFQTNLTAIQEVNDALVTINYDKEKLDEHKRQETLEQQDFQYSKYKYDSGIISNLDLKQFQENLYTVNKLTVDSQIACYIDYIGLYKAVGSKL